MDEAETAVRRYDATGDRDLTGLRWGLSRTWNIRPEAPRAIEPVTRARLAEHLLADLDVLEAAVGEPAPWRAALEQAA